MAYMTMHRQFAEIARTSLIEQGMNYQIELESLHDDRKKLDEWEAKAFEVDRIFPIQEKLDQVLLTTIVFSAMALEGYINFYAIKNFTKGYFEKHLDRIDIVTKWLLIPRLITGNEIPKDGRAFQLLNQLVSSRNYLVHAKATNAFQLDEDASEFILTKSASKMIDFDQNLFKKAKEAIEAMDILSLTMESLDTDENTSFDLLAPVGKRKDQKDEYGI